MAEARARFITFEGGEGAGKSTQIAELAGALQAAGISLITTREPGGSEAAEALRQLLVTGPQSRWDPLSEALLLLAARRDHLRSWIEPALRQGTWVLSDRFSDSTLAYQGYGHQLGPRVVTQLSELALDDIDERARKPDLTFVLDLDVEEGLRRAATRRGAEDRYESMGKAFHQRVREGFLEIAKSEPQRCALIDASQAPEAVAAEVKRRAGARLGIDLK